MYGHLLLLLNGHKINASSSGNSVSNLSINFQEITTLNNNISVKNYLQSNFQENTVLSVSITQGRVVYYPLDPASGFCGYQGTTAGTGIPAQAFILAEGSMTWQNIGGTNAWASASSLNGSLRFYAIDPTLLEIYCYQNQYNGGDNTLRLFIDGVYQSTSGIIPNTSSYGWNIVPAVMPTDGQPHEFRIMSPALLPNSMRVTGGSVVTTPILPLPMLAIYGDSRTNGTNVIDGTLTWNERIAGPLHMQTLSKGQSSSTVRYINSGPANQTTSCGEYRTDDILSSTNIWPPAEIILIVYGYNDFGGSYAGGYNSSLFIASYKNMLRKIIIGNPAAKIVVELVFAGSADDNLTQINNDIMTAVSNVGSSNIFVRSGMRDNYNPTTGGGVHPNDMACGLLSPYIISDIQSIFAVPIINGNFSAMGNSSFGMRWS